MSAPISQERIDAMTQTFDECGSISATAKKLNENFSTVRKYVLKSGRSVGLPGAYLRQENAVTKAIKKVLDTGLGTLVRLDDGRRFGIVSEKEFTT